MYLKFPGRRARPLAVIGLSLTLGACTQSADIFDSVTTSSIDRKANVAYSASERECMARAMFFESIRSSREGLVAVGTVVMNRVNSPEFPNTVCGVVGQKNQFAPGVMTRKMNASGLPDVMAAADAVLAGERHPKVHTAKYFHQAGLTFPYPNMHYVLEAGGNAFYERRSRRQRREMAEQQQAVAAAPAQQQAVVAQAPTQQAPAVEVAQEIVPLTVETSAALLAFEVEQGKADAIGALIASQRRGEAPR